MSLFDGSLESMTDRLEEISRRYSALADMCLPLSERGIALRKLALEDVPYLLEMLSQETPQMRVVERAEGRIRVKCDLCNQEHWQDDDPWFAHSPIFLTSPSA